LRPNFWGDAKSLEEIGKTALTIANAKTFLTFSLFRGVPCNILVDLACILVFAVDTASRKILGIFFPISAFVASGYEHSIANMFFVPVGLFIKGALRLEIADIYDSLT